MSTLSCISYVCTQMAALVAVFAISQTGLADELFTIRVVEAKSGWPVPLVELRTTHNERFITDNAGMIAFDLPELMGRETWFFVEGHGYEVPTDGFGFRGVRLTPKPGEQVTLKVKRKLSAKRLGRMTGGGIFGESQRLGLEKAWQEQGILGCDSVQLAIHRDRLHWFWGDTTLAHYPLGIFHVSGATTAVQPLKSFEPPLRLRYDYVTDKLGTPREVGKMPGSGPTWISGTVSLPDKRGVPHLVGAYVKIKPPLSAYECGLCVWNDAKERFEPHHLLWKQSPDEPKPPRHPDGHAIFYTDPAGKRWILFGDPFPHLKCAATFEAWSDPVQWKHLEPQQTVKVRGSDEAITPHRGSIAWNAYRQKWVAIFTELHGKASLLGEIWYAESPDGPTGPWGTAVKVVTHNNYTFYNPCLHPELTLADSPILLFEGTYTKQFSNNAQATPRHDYNQILYRLDLDDRTLVE